MKRVDICFENLHFTSGTPYLWDSKPIIKPTVLQILNFEMNNDIGYMKKDNASTKDDDVVLKYERSNFSSRIDITFSSPISGLNY